MGAVADVKQQLFERAAELLEAAESDLELRDGKVQVRGVPTKALTPSDIIRRTRSGNLIGQGKFVTHGGLDPETGQGRATVHWHQAAAAAEVEVDLETGHVKLLRYEARGLLGPDDQPRPGRAPGGGQPRIRPGPGAVRGDALRQRAAPERQPGRLHGRELRGHAARPRDHGRWRIRAEPRSTASARRHCRR